MVKRILVFSLCLTMVMMASLALAGGKVVAPVAPVPVACAPQPCGPTVGPNPAYWGDAPFPGLCGGVVALPFLVVGSLLGGNTAAPYAPPAYGPPAPRPYGPVPMAPGYAPCPPPACGPVAPVGCGPAPYGSAGLGGGLLGGLPCLELCSGILGGLGGGLGFGL
jgi:hypothetical protein